MRVAFRVDAAPHIGGGHLARCLTLADALRKAGSACHFLTGPLSAVDTAQIAAHGHSLHLIAPGGRPVAADADFAHAHWLGSSQEVDAKVSAEQLLRLGIDWTVVDHYGIDYRWQHYVRSFTRKLMVIDDLADRQHDCDLLLDQNYYSDFDQRYRGLMPRHCRSLLGPQFALLRPEFGIARSSCHPRRGVARRVFAFVSSFDPDNQTGKVLDAIIEVDDSTLSYDLVVGHNHPFRKALAARVSGMQNCAFHSPALDIASLMSQADLAIGAGGSTTLERCFLGLPTLSFHVAANQQPMLQDLSDAGCVAYLGAAQDVSAVTLAYRLKALLNDEPSRVSMSNLGWDLVADGKGAVIANMKDLLND